MTDERTNGSLRACEADATCHAPAVHRVNVLRPGWRVPESRQYCIMHAAQVLPADAPATPVTTYDAPVRRPLRAEVLAALRDRSHHLNVIRNALNRPSPVETVRRELDALIEEGLAVEGPPSHFARQEAPVKPGKTAAPPLTQHERVIEDVRAHPWTSVGDIMRRTEDSSASARLVQAVQAGTLVRIGEKRSYRYAIPGTPIPGLGAEGGPTMPVEGESADCNAVAPPEVVSASAPAVEADLLDVYPDAYVSTDPECRLCGGGEHVNSSGICHECAWQDRLDHANAEIRKLEKANDGLGDALLRVAQTLGIRPGDDRPVAVIALDAAEEIAGIADEHGIPAGRLADRVEAIVQKWAEANERTKLEQNSHRGTLDDLRRVRAERDANAHFREWFQTVAGVDENATDEDLLSLRDAFTAGREAFKELSAVRERLRAVEDDRALVIEQHISLADALRDALRIDSGPGLVDEVKRTRSALDDCLPRATAYGALRNALWRGLGLSEDATDEELINGSTGPLDELEEMLAEHGIPKGPELLLDRVEGALKERAEAQRSAKGLLAANDSFHDDAKALVTLRNGLHAALDLAGACSDGELVETARDAVLCPAQLAEMLDLYGVPAEEGDGVLDRAGRAFARQAWRDPGTTTVLATANANLREIGGGIAKRRVGCTVALGSGSAFFPLSDEAARLLAPLLFRGVTVALLAPVPTPTSVPTEAPAVPVEIDMPF